MAKPQKRQTVFELNKLIDQEVQVKFAGGREIVGVLKGYDGLLNLVLDDAVEHLRDPYDPYKLSGETRKIGLVVSRGTAVIMIAPMDGAQQIANPFQENEAPQPVID